jgi:hypothetical protein
VTHEEEFEAFVGPLNGEDDYGLYSGCHDYPCSCTVDDLMLHDDRDAEIDAHVKREPAGQEHRRE